MRVLTATVASLAALAAATVAGVEISSHVLGEAKASAPAAAMMAMPVPVAAVVKQTVPIYLDFPGRTESIRSIVLQARASGYVESQPAPDGADVKSGDLLYQIDPRDLQAALDQAQAQVRRDAASLEYAKANFARGEELAKSGFVAKDVFDQRESAMHQAEAALAVDQAAADAARLNLGYTEIRAPINGRTGQLSLHEGALVKANDGAFSLVTINQMANKIVTTQAAGTNQKIPGIFPPFCYPNIFT